MSSHKPPRVDLCPLCAEALPKVAAHVSWIRYVLAPVGPGDVDPTASVAIVREDLEEGRYRVLGSAPSGEVAIGARLLVATLEGLDLADVGATSTAEGVDITVPAGVEERRS